jgi:hypothetical protein
MAVDLSTTSRKAVEQIHNKSTTNLQLYDKSYNLLCNKSIANRNNWPRHSYMDNCAKRRPSFYRNVFNYVWTKCVCTHYSVNHWHGKTCSSRPMNFRPASVSQRSFQFLLEGGYLSWTRRVQMGSKIGANLFVPLTNWHSNDSVCNSRPSNVMTYFCQTRLWELL